MGPTAHERRRAARAVAPVLASLVVALLAAACASTPTTSTPQNQAAPTDTKPVPGGRLVFGMAGEPDGWLPQASRFSPSAIVVAKAVFDPLAVLGADGNVHAYLAQSINPNANFTAWDIKARPGITFHNGEAFDGEALFLNLDTFWKSALTVNAMKPVKDIAKIDDMTVRVTMNQVWANFPTLFTTQVGYFAAPAQIKAVDTQKPIGTGPFKFDAWTRGSSFKASKNTQYWRTGLPYLDQVEFRAISDTDSRRAALEAGDVDIVHTNTSEDLVRFTKHNDPPKGTKVLVDEFEGDEYTIVLNTQSGPFTDKNLRIALAKATDKVGLNSTQFEDIYEVANQPYAPKSRWHIDGVKSVEFDLAGAKRMVEEYKQAHGGEAPRFTFTTVASTEDTKLSQVLQQQWQTAGFEILIENQDETRFAATIISGKFEAFGFKFFNNPDPDGDFYFWTNSTIGGPGEISLNFPRYRSEVVEEALQQGRQNIDPEVRKAAYGRIWQDWAENVPYIFLFHAKWTLIYSERVHGLGSTKAPDGAPLPPIVWGTTFLTDTWIQQTT